MTLGNLILLLLSTVLAFGTCDLFLGKMTKEKFSRNITELGWIKGTHVEPDLGFFSSGPTYQNWILTGNYRMGKNPDKERVIFIGDSVTENSAIVPIIKEKYKENKYEFINAGVSAYNIDLILKFYEKYVVHASPDHIVYLFHLNDYEITPFIIKENDRVINAYSPLIDAKTFNFFLYKHSFFYRMYVHSSLKTDYQWDTRYAEVKELMTELKNNAESRGIKFTVLIPSLSTAFENWPSTVHAHYKASHRILTELNIEYYDLRPALEEAIKASVPLEDGDIWHPSPELSRYFVEYLQQTNFLKEN
jgi:hypothetical protein